jgi:Fe2+ or Zn2+ uptake regulation protein
MGDLVDDINEVFSLQSSVYKALGRHRERGITGRLEIEGARRLFSQSTPSAAQCVVTCHKAAPHPTCRFLSSAC